MASDQTPAATPAPAPVAPATPVEIPQDANKKLIVYHHSNLFYWWPVWALSFLFALITYFEDHHLAVVPAGTKTFENRSIILKDDGEAETRSGFVLSEKAKLVTRPDHEGKHAVLQPTLYISSHKTLGVLYVGILLLVIWITNVPMRGLLSAVVLMGVIVIALLIALMGWWEVIFSNLRNLSIHINMGGYLCIGTVLFVLWLLNFYIFDRQTYMIFTPGAVRMRLTVGEGEIAYDTTGMIVHKHRDDIFRHMILGFGSGDLEIRPAGQQSFIQMPNVLNVSKVVRTIQHFVAERVVEAAPADEKL